jgi:hypothetical protein
MSRRIVGGQANKVWHRATEPQASEEPHKKQLIEGRDEGCGEREQAKGCGRDDKHRPASDPVSQCAKKQGAEGEAQKGRAENHAEGFDRYVDGRRHEGAHDSHDLNIEPVQHGDEAAKKEYLYSK